MASAAGQPADEAHDPRHDRHLGQQLGRAPPKIALREQHVAVLFVGLGAVTNTLD